MRVVISQPMYLPWGGLFDQIKKADIFVHYDDVALPQGRSFINRVQLSHLDHFKWLTVPLEKKTRKNCIKDVQIDASKNWIQQHTNALKSTLSKNPHYHDVKALLAPFKNSSLLSLLADLNIAFIENISAYLGLQPSFLRSQDLKTKSRSSQKLLDICKALGATTYLTGHGAKSYLDHNLFEEHGIAVEYMEYEILPPKNHSLFNPFTTILELISHVGPEAGHHLNAKTINWRNFDGQ